MLFDLVIHQLMMHSQFIQTQLVALAFVRFLVRVVALFLIPMKPLEEWLCLEQVFIQLVSIQEVAGSIVYIRVVVGEEQHQLLHQIAI